MHLLGCSNHVGEIFDNSIALCLRYPDNLSHEAGIEEKTVPAGDRVCANERVLSCDSLAANCSAKGSCIGSLHIC
jgi:hypothetical protein